MRAARLGVLVVVGTMVGTLPGCVNLSYPPGASRDGGALVTQQPLGKACSKDNECQSGFCVDAVCCKEKCEGDCSTCALPGSPGLCMPALADTNPRGRCQDLTAAKCSTNGKCDNNGQCAKYPNGTECEPASCLVFDAFLASRCNDGVCEKGAKKDCAPYVCGPTGACLTACTMPRECAAMKCDENGTCGLKALGTTCGGPGECQSNHCVGGLCCDSDCDSPCKTCGLKGSEGVCTNVPAGSPPPAGTGCAASDPSTCGTNGKCNGAGACQLFPSGTVCSPASCSTATLRNAGTCDGQMHCQVPAAVTCGGYTCASTTACRTTCAADADCASPAICGVPRVNACGGLSAQYFRQTNLTDLAFSRTDPYIDFDWHGSSPSPLLNVDNFSVRWRGKLTPRFSEAYIFYAATDDGERLFIDGKSVIDHFSRHASVPEDVSGAVMLTAGKPVDITFEYFENGGDANVRLSWSSKSELKAVIPTTAFAPQ